MDLLEIAVVAIVFPIITGVLVWYITTRFSEKRLQKSLKIKVSELSGKWEGIHLSRDDSQGGTIVSRHRYDLTVSSSGKIKGTCEELSAKPPYEYNINGIVNRGEIFLFGEIKTAPSYAWFFNLYNLDRIPGFILSYDFDGRPFVSYIILSRRKIDEEEYFASLKKEADMFYIYPVKKSK